MRLSGRYKEHRFLWSPSRDEDAVMGRRLARAFARRVVEAAGDADRLDEIRRRNVVHMFEDLEVDRTCATHDFFDGNQVMIDAFVEVFGRNPWESDEGASEDDTYMVSNAWTLAKIAHFREELIYGDE
jgi:hypothetical protein